MRKKIIVGIDITDLKLSFTGQKTVLEEIYNHLQLRINDSDQNKNSIINDLANTEKSIDNFVFHFFVSPLPHIKSRKKVFLLIYHIFHQFWKQILLPIKAWINRCDIIFCTDYFVPRIQLGFKTVQIFHDAFFFENPEHYNKYWRWIHKYLSMPAAKKSSFIIVPTEYALEKIHQYTHIHKNKLVKIYQGPKSLFIKGASINDPALSSFVSKKYILHVGNMEKRKNLPFVVNAFGSLIANNQYKDLVLVLVGAGTGRIESDDTKNIKDRIKKLEIENNVIFAGYLSNEQLKTAYENAFMYVFASLNEGFGIPILEAFASKIPVLIANNSCLPEVAENAALSFDPFNEKDLIDKMRMVLEDLNLRQKMIGKGSERLKMFSWDLYIDELLQVFAKTIN